MVVEVAVKGEDVLFVEQEFVPEVSPHCAAEDSAKIFAFGVLLEGHQLIKNVGSLVGLLFDADEKGLGSEAQLGGVAGFGQFAGQDGEFGNQVGEFVDLGLGDEILFWGHRDFSKRKANSHYLLAISLDMPAGAGFGRVAQTHQDFAGDGVGDWMGVGVVLGLFAFGHGGVMARADGKAIGGVLPVVAVQVGAKTEFGEEGDEFVQLGVGWPSTVVIR